MIFIYVNVLKLLLEDDVRALEHFIWLCLMHMVFVTGFVFVVVLHFVLFDNSLEFQSRSSLASESTIQIPPYVRSFRALLLTVFTLLQINCYILYSNSRLYCVLDVWALY